MVYTYIKYEEFMVHTYIKYVYLKKALFSNYFLAGGFACPTPYIMFL